MGGAGPSVVTDYRRLPDGWEQESYGVREVVELKSVGLSLPLARIYEDIPE